MSGQQRPLHQPRLQAELLQPDHRPHHLDSRGKNIKAAKN